MNWTAFWVITLGLPGIFFLAFWSRLFLDWVEDEFGLGWSAAVALLMLSAMIGLAVGSYEIWNRP